MGTRRRRYEPISELHSVSECPTETTEGGYNSDLDKSVTPGYNRETQILESEYESEMDSASEFDTQGPVRIQVDNKWFLLSFSLWTVFMLTPC